MNMRPARDQRFWLLAVAISALGLVMLITLEFTDIDRALARLAFDSARHAFPLQNDAGLVLWTHEVPRIVAAVAFAWILVAIWRPLGPLRGLGRPARIYLFAAVAVCLLIVSLLKRGSALHCPWGLAEFGGEAQYLRLFDPVPADWVRGRCFPAGHVLSAFAFIGGYFAFAPSDRRLARRWLTAVLLAGALTGIAQQVRGAHFLSHTLWTLWWCWTLSALLAWLLRPVNRGTTAPG